MKTFLTKCVKCQSTTSRQYARNNAGQCKTCVTGVAQPKTSKRSRNHDDIAREGGYEDTMGCSPDVMENRYGSSGDY